ncbi:MAG: regulatory protein RecX [Gammaproteobacteria bacterium]|nr:regulatory protein RecX [Gammaproteobacteria bacterium]
MRMSEESAVTEARDIRQAATKYLAIREHSTLELTRKLLDKQFDEVAISNVLNDLKSQSLLSDERFTENYVRYRKGKGFGSLHIQKELRERGVSEGLINKYVDASDDVWKVLVKAVQKKRFGDLLPENIEERAKQARFLQSRGFTSDQIWHLIGDGE